MSAWAHLIASTYARLGLRELAAVWRQHARALEVREQRQRDRAPLDTR